MKFSVSLFAATASLALVACDRQTTVAVSTPVPEPIARTNTLETKRLQASIDAYERNPTSENRADVNKATAELDGEIAELETFVAKHTGNERAEAEAKWNNLRSYRAAEIARFTAAQAKSTVTPSTATPRPDGRSAADKAENTAERVGESIENAAKKTSDAIKDAVR